MISRSALIPISILAVVSAACELVAAIRERSGTPSDLLAWFGAGLLAGALIVTACEVARLGLTQPESLEP